MTGMSDGMYLHALNITCVSLYIPHNNQSNIKQLAVNNSYQNHIYMYYVLHVYVNAKNIQLYVLPHCGTIV